MIKELTDNQDMKFRCVDGCLDSRDYVIGRDDDGYVKFFEHGKFRDAFFDIHQKFGWEWELVPQEVTWQEAIQAWLDGKDIRIELRGKTYIQHYVCRFGLAENSFNGFGKNFFTEGKWYIEN
jgi:hypothetical protein